MIAAVYAIDITGKAHQLPAAFVRGQSEESTWRELYHGKWWFPFIIKDLRFEHVRDPDEDQDQKGM
jgi:hypothetical protein